MLRLGVTQEWVDEGELPGERTKIQRWQRPYDVLAEATRGEVVIRVHHTRICMIGAAGELGCFSAHIRLREPDKSEDKADPVGLNYPKVKHRLERWWTRRSTTVPQRRIYRSRRKGYGCKSMDSRAMGLVAPWYHRGGTSVESSIPCSHGGRALVVKGGRGGEECKDKLQVLRQGERTKAKKLHKTDVDGLLIKIAESGGLRVDAGVLDQGTK
ncbi:hypothetical protein B296_00010363 [Ensete ventricosum]|uniref:Uncharacterized protein n=1 Tax=Ensete ventricosum TaxID=4639 RepID=A0A427B4J0_ENSVE|nr:hypothetical protein B296_00010363 [Ensete ventricosum]